MTQARVWTPGALDGLKVVDVLSGSGLELRIGGMTLRHDLSPPRPIDLCSAFNTIVRVVHKLKCRVSFHCALCSQR